MSEASSRKPEKLTGPEPVTTKRASSLARSACFRYYIHDGIAACRLQLLGELTEADIAELNGCWRTAKTTLAGRKLILDLHALKSVDEAGKQWLASMAGEGGICSPENFLRDLMAGRHSASAEPPAALPKPGVFSRLIAYFRGVDIEAAK